MLFNCPEYNKSDLKCQSSVLTDVSETGKKRFWGDKKTKNWVLAEHYENSGFREKSLRLKTCASRLVFRELPDGTKKLDSANFCHVRLCPICAWRRTQKIYWHTSQIMEAMERDKQYAYLLLTLTVPNVPGDLLSHAMDQMMGGWKRLSECKDFQRAVKGWYRGLEVTHNVNRDSPSFDTYHPHFHCILTVNKSYFANSTYLSHGKWLELWRRSMRMPDITQVDVRKIKGNTAKAVAETAKYAVKDADYLIDNDEVLTHSSIQVLDPALAGRRLVAFGGVMKEFHKKLNLDDEVDGDLVNVGEDQKTADDPDFKLVAYVWSVGFDGSLNYWRSDEELLPIPKNSA